MPSWARMRQRAVAMTDLPTEEEVPWIMRAFARGVLGMGVVGLRAVLRVPQDNVRWLVWLRVTSLLGVFGFELMSTTVVEQLSIVRVSIAVSGRFRSAVIRPFIEPPWPTRTTSPPVSAI